MTVDVCENPYVLKILLFVLEIFKVVFYVIPIGLIVMLTLDFFKGVISGEDRVSGQFVFVVKRLINTVALFLVPTFISFFMQFLSDLDLFNGEYSSCLKNTSNVSFYTEKYQALEKQMEEERQKEISKKLSEYEYKTKLLNEKRNRILASSASDSSSVFVGQRYNLSDSQIRNLTAVCIGEQGAYKDGVATEASVMANLYEESISNKSGRDYSSVYDFVYNSGWFNSQTIDNHALNEVTDELFNAVKDVLVNGNRTLPLYVNEHDCWFCTTHRCYNGNKGDVCYLNNGGSNLSSAAEIKNRDNYISGKTKVYTYYMRNNSDSDGKYFIFYGWARPSTKGGDPFGYTESNYKRIKGLG